MCFALKTHDCFTFDLFHVIFQNVSKNTKVKIVGDYFTYTVQNIYSQKLYHYGLWPYDNTKVCLIQVTPAIRLGNIKARVHQRIWDANSRSGADFGSKIRDAWRIL